MIYYKKLKLLIADRDDLLVLSSLLQDAIVKIGDIRFDKSARTVNMRFSRYMHEQTKRKDSKREPVTTKPNKNDRGLRIESGLRIDGVNSLQSREINQNNPKAFAVLLGVEFTPSVNADALPAGDLDFIFAGGGILRLSVEALDLSFTDTDNRRMTSSQPQHDI